MTDETPDRCDGSGWHDPAEPGPGHAPHRIGTCPDCFGTLDVHDAITCVGPGPCERPERRAADGVSPPVGDGTDTYGVPLRRHGLEITRGEAVGGGTFELSPGHWNVPETMRDALGDDALDAMNNLDGIFRVAPTVKVNRDDLVDQPSLRAQIQAAMASLDAHYEPTGLVLHPFDHERLVWDGKPWTAEKIAAMKSLAEAMSVPYWHLDVPGYPVPLLVRIRGRVDRVKRAVREAPGRLPGVQRYYGDGWPGVAEPRTGRWWIRVGRWAIGRGYEPW